MSNPLLFPLLKNYLKTGQTVTVATLVRGPEVSLGIKALVPAVGQALGPLLDTAWRDDLLRDARQLMQAGQSATRRYQNDQVEIFFDVHAPAPQLIIVGAVHIANALIHYAKPLGFCTWLVDPRTAFATRERFPHADKICHQWPDEALPDIGLTPQTGVVVITHDPKLDDPALKLALSSPVFYVGALGSKKTHAHRVKRLVAAGVTPEQLNRLHAPIGLNIGGRSPAQIALSIMAQIVAVQNNAVPANKPSQL